MDEKSRNFPFLHLAKLFGQFPAISLKNYPIKFQFNWLTFIWSLFFIIFHIICSQTVFWIEIYAIQAHFSPSSHYDLGSFMFLRRLGMIWHVIVCIEIYLSYLSWWFWVITNCPKMVNAFYEFESKFVYKNFNNNEDPIKRSIFSEILKFGRWFGWWFNSIIAGVGFQYLVMLCSYEFGPEIKQHFYLNSWLINLLQIPEIVGILIFLHMTICTLSLTSTCELVFLHGDMILNTLKRITKKIKGLNNRGSSKQQDIFDLDDVNNTSTSIQLFKLKVYHHENISKLYELILELNLLFKRFVQFANGPLLIFVACLFIQIVWLVFMVAVILIFSFSENWAMIISIFTFSMTIIFILVVVTDYGEKILRQANELKHELLCINESMVQSIPNELDSLNSLHRFIINGGLKFQMSGFGYFKVKRKLFMSMMGAIISYNIVIVQFQISFGTLGSIGSPYHNKTN